jgi:hypothetical protein
MQTGKWMSNSDSIHFSDKLSYKTFCILSNGLKDMNYARFKHLQQFSENRKTGGSFLTEENLVWAADRRAREVDWTLTRLESRPGAGSDRRMGTTCQDRKGQMSKNGGFAFGRIRTQVSG